MNPNDPILITEIEALQIKLNTEAEKPECGELIEVLAKCCAYLTDAASSDVPERQYYLAAKVLDPCYQIPPEILPTPEQREILASVLQIGAALEQKSEAILDPHKVTTLSDLVFFENHHLLVRRYVSCLILGENLKDTSMSLSEMGTLTGVALVGLVATGVWTWPSFLGLIASAVFWFLFDLILFTFVRRRRDTLEFRQKEFLHEALQCVLIEFRGEVSKPHEVAGLRAWYESQLAAYGDRGREEWTPQQYCQYGIKLLQDQGTAVETEQFLPRAVRLQWNQFMGV